MIGYQHPVIWGYTEPPFLQTCSEIGEKRDAFSPIRGNKPPEGSTSLFLFAFMIFLYMYKTIYIVMYKCTDLLTNLLEIWATGGSATTGPRC